MNLGELRDQFRVQAQDFSVPPLWPDTELDYWFNEAEDEAAIRAGLIVDKTIEYGISVGDTELDLDPCVIEIRYAALTDATGAIYPIAATDRNAMDRTRPDWRTRSMRPDGYIHNDTSLDLNAPADAAYTLKIECTRKPAQPMSNESDRPEIAAHHHKNLLDWVLFRAYEKPDADTFNPGKGALSLERFEKYFGRRKTADLRKRQQANRPHRNIPQW